MRWKKLNFFSYRPCSLTIPLIKIPKNHVFISDIKSGEILTPVKKVKPVSHTGSTVDITVEKDTTFQFPGIGLCCVFFPDLRKVYDTIDHQILQGNFFSAGK